jgi:hypothetical protein
LKEWMSLNLSGISFLHENKINDKTITESKCFIINDFKIIKVRCHLACRIHIY